MTMIEGILKEKEADERGRQVENRTAVAGWHGGGRRRGGRGTGRH